MYTSLERHSRGVQPPAARPCLREAYRLAPRQTLIAPCGEHKRCQLMSQSHNAGCRCFWCGQASRGARWITSGECSTDLVSHSRFSWNNEPALRSLACSRALMAAISRYGSSSSSGSELAERALCELFGCTVAGAPATWSSMESWQAKQELHCQQSGLAADHLDNCSGAGSQIACACSKSCPATTPSAR